MDTGEGVTDLLTGKRRSGTDGRRGSSARTPVCPE